MEKPLFRRDTYYGVRYLIFKGGEIDYAWHGDRVVSINHDYAHNGNRNPIGIRWDWDKHYDEPIPDEDLDWLKG